MHHLLTRALAGSVLLFASNSVLAHEDAPDNAPATTTTKAKGKESRSPQLIDPGFTAGELKTRVSIDEIVKLRKVPMPDGTTIDADLAVWTPFGPDCALQFSRKGVAGKSVHRVLEMKDVTFLKGHVRGKKDSVVMIAAKDDRMEGFFSYEGTTARITRDTSEPTPKDVILPGLRPDRVLPPEGSGCGMSLEDLAPNDDTSMADGGLAGASGDCHLIRIALELDYELYSNSLNEDGLATLVYVAKILYTTDEVIRRDLGAQIELASVNVWTEPDDPWTSDHFETQLDEFMNYCNDPSNHMLDTPRDATMLLSGRGIGGGQAGGIGALSCDDPESAYLVCGHMSGDFPYPAVMNHDDNWDIQHFIHEFGHLLNGWHTHTLNPPVDTCSANCSEPQRGSVMSYCHRCPGEYKNRGLWFHMRNQDRARGYLDTIGCLEGRQASIAAYDDEAAAYGNSSTRIDVLLNDGAVCSQAHIHSHDVFSTQGGIVRLMASAGLMGRDVLQYFPPRGFLGTDSFTYQAADQYGNVSMAQVVVEVEPAPFITEPEYLVVDMIENSISRLDAHTHTFKGHFVPELEEVMKDPSSILPLPDGSVLVGDRSLKKILEFDVNGEYQGVFFEHPDLFYPEAMAHADGEVFIMDALGGWVFKVHLDGGVGYSVFQGTGTGRDAALGSDGTLWISGNVNGNAVIGIDPETGMVRREIYLLETITQPGAISTAYGALVVADEVTGAVATFDALGDGAMLSLLLSESGAASAWFGGGLEMCRAADPNVSFLRYGMITTAGVFELDEFGTLMEIGQHGSSLFSQASAIGYRAVPDRSPDINSDGCVNGSDLSLVLSYFNESSSSFPEADLDLNGRIDGADLTILLGAWADCP
jgi:hypothetical protein